LSQHPLPYIAAQCRSAGVVWLALTDYANARESAKIAPGLQELSDLSGVPRRTVSEALWVLEQAGWIRLKRIPIYRDGKRSATALRIKLRREWRLWRNDKCRTKK
jgi:Mn-dependent DtxR family transcriptional regulator